jgi:hypothetical protein
MFVPRSPVIPALLGHFADLFPAIFLDLFSLPPPALSGTWLYAAWPQPATKHSRMGDRRLLSIGMGITPPLGALQTRAGRVGANAPRLAARKFIPLRPVSKLALARITSPEFLNPELLQWNH